MSTFQTDKTTIDEKQISLHLQLKDLKKKIHLDDYSLHLMTMKNTKECKCGDSPKFLEQPVQVVRCGLCTVYIPLNNECSLEIDLLLLLVPSVC